MNVAAMLEVQRGLPMRLIGQHAYPTPYTHTNAGFDHRLAEINEIQILKDNE
jgi:hypothetical protein